MPLDPKHPESVKCDEIQSVPHQGTATEKAC